MAFINEEERKFDFNNEKEKFIVGPGQYLPLTEKKVYKESIAPFESSSPKLYARINKNPGPGSYYVDSSTKAYSKAKANEKIMQIEKIAAITSGSTIATKDNAIITEIRQARAKVRKNYERLGFSVKEKRFRDDALLSSLGPGYYLNENNKNEPRAISARCQEMKNKVVKLQPGQIKGNHDHIASIPQKEYYGFAIDDKSSSLIPKGNPDNYKFFSGIKGDTVGPGSYDIDFPEKWRTTGTNWSKMKGSHLLDKENNRVQGVKDLLNEFHQNEKKQSRDVYDDNDIEQFKQLAALSRVSLKQLMKRDMENKAKKKVCIGKGNSAKSNFPGPGYYFDMQLHSEFSPSYPYDDQNIFFGCKQERFGQTMREKREALLGPGSYFNVKKSKVRTKRNVFEKKPPFASNTDRFSASTQSSLSLPGPGAYESESSIASNHFSKTSSAFYAHQKRFIEAQKEIERVRQIPGPGSYLDAFSNTGSSNTVEMNGRFIDSRTAQEFTRKRAQTASKPMITTLKTGGASVGSYNPGYPLTIEYKNIKKSTGLKREVAFNSSCSYKFNQSAQHNVGPGSYFIESFTEVNQRKLPPPNQLSNNSSKPNKENKSKEGKESLGPGVYNYDDLYSWHKKSFNIKYL